MVLRLDQTSPTELVELQFRPVGARRTFEEVAVQLQEAILDGRLLRGQRLPPERELAQQFQVSRTSIREALRGLEALGLLSSRRGAGDRSGSVVGTPQNGLASVLPLYAKLKQVPLGDLVDLRESIEAMTARRAAANPDAGEAIHAVLVWFDGAFAPKSFLEVDTRFHITIAEQSQNAVAAMFMEALRDAMAREMLSRFEAIEDWPTARHRLVAEHRKIARLIASGDGNRASAAMTKHIRDFYL